MSNGRPTIQRNLAAKASKSVELQITHSNVRRYADQAKDWPYGYVNSNERSA